MSARRLLALALVLALAGTTLVACGRKGPLEPRPAYSALFDPVRPA